LSSGVTLLHDNVRPHAAARTQAMLQEFGWEVFEYPAYSPDLAPSDFHFFPKLKEFLGGRRFKIGEEVKDWRRRSMTKAFKNSSHAMTSA
jgi:histone-lysine N-methyltransferase SETMAR